MLYLTNPGCDVRDKVHWMAEEGIRRIDHSKCMYKDMISFGGIFRRNTVSVLIHESETLPGTSQYNNPALQLVLEL